jgi:hypothetical protein
MRRALLLLSMTLGGLAVAPLATADKPIRELIPAPDDIVITGQCAFPVLAHIEGTEVDTTFVDKDGNPIRLLGTFPGNMLTLTRVGTSKSLTLPATGSFQLRANPDGTASAMITGQGPSFPNPITGEPGIWYLSGRLTATLDADGNATSMKNTGQLVDLCLALAA